MGYHRSLQRVLTGQEKKASTARRQRAISRKPGGMGCSRWKRLSAAPRPLQSGGGQRSGGGADVVVPGKGSRNDSYDELSTGILIGPPISCAWDRSEPFHTRSSITICRWFLHATCSQGFPPLHRNHTLHVRAGPSACVHQKGKARAFLPHSALIYTCAFTVSVCMKAEFVFLQ